MASLWKVEFEPRALQELRKLDRPGQVRILRFLHERVAGSDDPRRSGKALQGARAGLWRYRVGDYRLICRIQDETITVLVLRIRHRKDACR